MEPVQYDQFILEIRRDDQIIAKLTASADSGTTTNTERKGNLKIDERVRELIEYLIDLLGRGTLDELGLQLLGKNLFEILFPDDIGDLFKRAVQAVSDKNKQLPGSCRLRIWLDVDPESSITTWPLEFVRCEARWLATENRLFTLSRKPSFSSTYTTQRHPPPLKVLIVVSKPTGLGGVMTLAIDDIAKWAAREMKPAGGTAVSEPPRIQIKVLGLIDDFELPSEPAEYLNLHANLANFEAIYGTYNPDIVHFIGHGRCERDKPQLALVLDEGRDPEWCGAGELQQVFSGGQPTLVVLQACESAKEGTGKGFTSMAAHLIQQNVPAVVAMQYDLRNDCAIEFGAGFYRALADGLDIDAAVQRGRSMISYSSSLKVRWKERHFGTPVLYTLRPDGIILPGQKGTRFPSERPAETPIRASVRPIEVGREAERPAASETNVTAASSNLEERLKNRIGQLVDQKEYDKAKLLMDELAAFKQQEAFMAEPPSIVPFPCVAKRGTDAH